MATKQAKGGGLLRQRLRVGRGYLRDRITGRTVTDLDDVPPFSWAVSPEWLTAALCADKDARVVGVRHEPVSSGTTDRSRLILEYAGSAEDVADLPATVFVKSTDSYQTRLQVGAVGGATGEIRFYQQIEPSTPIVAPRGYYGAAHRPSGRSILLLEDLGKTPGLVFGDCRNLLNRTRAEALVDAMAVVHGCLLESPRFDTDLRWTITSELMQRALNAYVDFERRTVVGVDRGADIIPEDVRKRRDQIHSALMRSLDLDRGAALGLNHSDVHAGNWFITSDDEMGLYDWAAMVRGQGTRDLVYALMSALTIEDRRNWERDLIARYTERRAEISGKPHDEEAVWTSYRQQTLHGLTFWLYTLGGGPMQPSMQVDAISRTNIERMAQAAVDLDTFAALDA